MKILYINNFFTRYGGAENSINLISSLMKEKGHEVYHYATNKQPYFIEEYEYSKYFPEFQHKRALSINDFGNILKTFYNKEAKKNLKKYLKEVKPDVVSIHNIQYHLTPSVIDACKEFNIPIMLYIHDPRMFCPGGTLSYGEKYCNDEPCVKGFPVRCITRKCKENNLKASLMTALNVLYTRYLNIYEKIDIAICPSRAIMKLAGRADVPEEKLSVLHHFIDNKKLSTDPGYENYDYFLYVGRLDREKGVHLLIEAMQSLPRDIELHIVGDGYEKDNLTKLANKSGLKNVVFKGYLSGSELENEYKNSLATILPCNWFEVFGRTLLESFLYGKPVIASNIAAIPEIVEDKTNGLLIEPQNIDALINSMSFMANNKALAKELGKNGRKKLENTYNSENYYKNYLNILEKLIRN